MFFDEVAGDFIRTILECFHSDIGHNFAPWLLSTNIAHWGRWINVRVHIAKPMDIPIIRSSLLKLRLDLQIEKIFAPLEVTTTKRWAFSRSSIEIPHANTVRGDLPKR